MYRRHRIRKLILVVTILASLNACAATGSTGTGASAPVTRDGPAQTLGRGTAHTYAVSDAEGRTREVGVRLSPAVLDGLPEDPADPTTKATLALPPATGTAFDHVEVGWNPQGHAPVGLFDKPHFDVHFYMVDPAAVAAVDPNRPDYAARAGSFPAPRYIPRGYVPPLGPPAVTAVPMMGLHWTDTADHAVPGHFDFRQVFINGTWDGRYTFMEPMITREFLLARGSVDAPIAQPEAYQRDGSYPSAYHVHVDATSGEYVVALDGLVPRIPS